MIRDKDKIIELENRINQIEKEKNNLINSIQKTFLQLQNKKISLEEYKETISKLSRTLGINSGACSGFLSTQDLRLLSHELKQEVCANANLDVSKNKTPEKIIKYYDFCINLCKKHIEITKKDIIKNKTNKAIKITYFIILISLILSTLIYFLYPHSSIQLAPPQQITYISNTDSWLYNDLGVYPGATWTAITFDDSTWKTGNARLARGTQEASYSNTALLTCGAQTCTTYYFRKHFTVSDTSQISTMAFNIDYDDSYIVYLNSQEISRSSNLAGIADTSFASLATSIHNWMCDGEVFPACIGSSATLPIFPEIQLTPIQLGYLINGDNVLSVQIKQNSVSSSDAAMMLDLHATLIDSTPPIVTINSPLDGSTISDPTPLIDISTDESSTITYQIDSGPTQTACTNCISSNFFLDLAEGTHALQVSAQDTAGNIGSTSSTFTINFANQFQDTYDDDSSIRNLINVIYSPGGVSLSSTPSTNTLTFQGTAEVDDTEIRADLPTSNYGTLTSFNIDGQNPHAHALIKFPNIFGTNPGQIPLGSTILSATLTLYCTNEGNNQITYRLLEDWIENQATWNNRITATPWLDANGGAEQAPSIDTSSAITLTGCNTAANRNTWTNYNILNFVQSWKSGTPNYGFVIIDTGTNGVDYSSSESAQSPVLSITYEVPAANSGSFESTQLRTINPIISIDSITWTETGTDANNFISIEIFDGTSWQSIINGGSLLGLNTNTLAYRASFSTLDPITILLNDINIQWSQQSATPPIIAYGPNTPPDASSANQDFILIDVDIIEEKLKDITFNLYDSTLTLINTLTTFSHFSFDLPRYAIITDNQDLAIDPDTSGVAYNPATNTLFAIHNGVPKIDELDLNGNLIKSIPLTGFVDTESIAYIETTAGVHKFAIVEERNAKLYHVFIEATTTTIDISQAIMFDLGIGTFPGNNGIEGITYDSSRNVYYAVKEWTPMRVYKIDINQAPVSTTILFDAEAKFDGSQGISLTDQSDLFYDINTDSLFILSHESHILIQTSLDGTIKNSLSVSNMMQPEGITFDTYGDYLYIVGEPDFFSKWKTSSFLSKSTFPTLAPGLYYYDVSVSNLDGLSSSTPQRSITLTSTNNPPIIEDISNILDQTVTESGNKDVTFTILASDSDGVADLNDASITSQFTKSGEATRTGLCIWLADIDLDTAQYQCTIGLLYYDGSGTWTVSASIQDSAGASSPAYSETFILLDTPCITITPSSLTWNPLAPGAPAQYSNNDPLTITNTCNHEGSISIKSFNLIGITLPSFTIPSSSFKVNILDSQCSSGTQMNHNIDTLIPASLLQNGDNSLGSGKEELFLCIESVPNPFPSQQYSASGGNSWIISILLAPLAMKKRRKKKRESPDKLGIIEAIDEKLKEVYNISLSEISLKEIISNINLIKDNKLKIEIPIEIFKQKTSPAESLCKYLKENKNLTFTEIAKLLNRNQRTIWINYRNSNKKQKTAFQLDKSSLLIPSDIFSNRNLSILESLIIYLFNKGFKNKDISIILNKDPRNTYTLYSRGLKKNKTKK